MPTNTTPTVRILDSTFAYDERGEIVETVDYLPNGDPDWRSAGICDNRSGDGSFDALRDALNRTADAARVIGCEIVPAPIAD